MTRSGAQQRSLIMAVGAMLVQGSWAAYANWDFGVAAGVRAGIVQGTLSSVMTYVVTVTMEWVLGRMERAPRHVAVAAAAALAIATMIVLQAGMHWLAGTPRILVSILPAVIVGAFYCAIYSIVVTRRGAAHARSYEAPRYGSEL